MDSTSTLKNDETSREEILLYIINNIYDSTNLLKLTTLVEIVNGECLSRLIKEIEPNFEAMIGELKINEDEYSFQVTYSNMITLINCMDKYFSLTRQIEEEIKLKENLNLKSCINVNELVKGNRSQVILLCEALFAMTATSSVSEEYLKRIAELDEKYQEEWTNLLQKYIIFKDNETAESQVNTAQGGGNQNRNQTFLSLPSEIKKKFTTRTSQLYGFLDPAKLFAAIDKLRIKIETQEEQKLGLLQTISKQEKEKESLNTVIASSNERIQELEAKINDAVHETVAIRKNSLHRANSVEEFHEFYAKISQLEEKIGQRDMEIEELKRTILNEERKNLNLHHKIGRFEIEQEAKKKEIDELRTENEKLRNKLNYLNEMKQNAGRVDEMKKTLVGLSQMIDTYKETDNQTQEKIKDLETKLKYANEMTLRKKNKIRYLKQAIKVLNSKISSQDWFSLDQILSGEMTMTKVPAPSETLRSGVSLDSLECDEGDHCEKIIIEGHLAQLEKELELKENDIQHHLEEIENIQREKEMLSWKIREIAATLSQTEERNQLLEEHKKSLLMRQQTLSDEKSKEIEKMKSEVTLLKQEKEDYIKRLNTFEETQKQFEKEIEEIKVKKKKEKNQLRKEKETMYNELQITLENNSKLTMLVDQMQKEIENLNGILNEREKDLVRRKSVWNLSEEKSHSSIVEGVTLEELDDMDAAKMPMKLSRLSSKVLLQDADIKKFLEEISELRIEKEKFESRVKELTSIHEAEIQRLSNELKSSQNEGKELQNSRDQLKEENEKLKKEIENFKIKYETEITQIKKIHEKSIAKLTEEKQEALQQVDKILTENEKVKKKSEEHIQEEIKTNLHALTVKHEQEIKKLKENYDMSIAQLTQENKQYSIELAKVKNSLEKERSEKEKEIQNLKEKNEKEIANMKNKYETSIDVEKEEENKKSINQCKEKHEQEIKHLKEFYETSMSNLEKGLSTELQNLKESLEKNHNEKEVEIKKILQLQQAREQEMTKTISVLEDKLKSYENSIVKLKKENKDALANLEKNNQGEKEKQEKENQELKEKVKQATSKYEVISQEYAKHKMNYEKLQTEFTALKAEYDKEVLSKQKQNEISRQNSVPLQKESQGRSPSAKKSTKGGASVPAAKQGEYDSTIAFLKDEAEKAKNEASQKEEKCKLIKERVRMLEGENEKYVVQLQELNNEIKQRNDDLEFLKLAYNEMKKKESQEYDMISSSLYELALEFTAIKTELNKDNSPQRQQRLEL